MAPVLEPEFVRLGIGGIRGGWVWCCEQRICGWESEGMVTSVSEVVRASVGKSLGVSASRALMSFSLVSSFSRISRAM